MLKKHLWKNIYNNNNKFIIIKNVSLQISLEGKHSNSSYIFLLDVNFENRMLFIIQIEFYFCSKI